MGSQPPPSYPVPLTIRTEELGDRSFILPAGELDMSTTPLLERAILAAEAGDSRLVVVDMRRVTFMDVSALRVLLAASVRSKADSNRLRVVPGPRAVRRVFELTGTEGQLPFLEP